MQAVSELEKRFQVALENMDTGADIDAKVKENAELFTRIKDLETIEVDKDAEIRKLRESVTHLTDSEAKAVKLADNFQKDGAGAEKTVTDLQSTLDQVKAENKTALAQVSNLQGKLKEFAERPSDVVDTTGAAQELTDLRQQLEETEEKRQNHFAKISHLRGALIKLRTSVKDNVVNAEDINLVMQVELEALHTQMEALHGQRQTDLKEVNTILEKLTPLVEGK